MLWVIALARRADTLCAGSGAARRRTFRSEFESHTVHGVVGMTTFSLVRGSTSLAFAQPANDGVRTPGASPCASGGVNRTSIAVHRSPGRITPGMGRDRLGDQERNRGGVASSSVPADHQICIAADTRVRRAFPARAQSNRGAALISAAQSFIAARKLDVPIEEITQAADVGLGSSIELQVSHEAQVGAIPSQMAATKAARSATFSSGSPRGKGWRVRSGPRTKPATTSGSVPGRSRPPVIASSSCPTSA
jgi:hypothetical protein